MLLNIWGYSYVILSCLMNLRGQIHRRDYEENIAQYSLNNRFTINTSWPSVVMWRHASWSTSAQVMAHCLAAQSHYQNQCWNIGNVAINMVIDMAFTQGQFDGIFLKISIIKLCLRFNVEVQIHIPRDNELIHSVTLFLSTKWCHVIHRRLLHSLVLVENKQ